MGLEGNVNWFSEEIARLYGRGFPNALGLLNVDLPLYQGGRRLRQREQSRVVQQQLVYSLLAQRDDIVAGFGVSRTNYEQALNSYLVAVENLALAQGDLRSGGPTVPRGPQRLPRGGHRGERPPGGTLRHYR